MKMEEFASLKALTRIKETRKLFRLRGYYRSYVHDFSHDAECLHDLLSEEAVSDTAKKTSRTKRTGQLPPNANVVWTDIHQQALECLICSLTNPPIMVHPRLEEPVILHTMPLKKDRSRTTSETRKQSQS